jgi:hypothetical protein
LGHLETKSDAAQDTFVGLLLLYHQLSPVSPQLNHGADKLGSVARLLFGLPIIGELQFLSDLGNNLLALGTVDPGLSGFQCTKFATKNMRARMAKERSVSNLTKVSRTFG